MFRIAASITMPQRELLKCKQVLHRLGQFCKVGYTVRVDKLCFEWMVRSDDGDEKLVNSCVRLKMGLITLRMLGAAKLAV